MTRSKLAIARRNRSSFTAIVAAALLASAVTGCASARRAAVHLDPKLLFEEALSEHGGLATIPSSTAAAGLGAPLVLLAFEDGTVAPTGSYLDDRDATPISEVYLVPNVAVHLCDHTADAFRARGATVFRAYDAVTASAASLVAGRPPHRLEVALDVFELHRWMPSDPLPNAPVAAAFDLIRVSYRYRWRQAGVADSPVRRATHKLLLPADVDALGVVGRYIVREVLAHRN